MKEPLKAPFRRYANKSNLRLALESPSGSGCYIATSMDSGPGGADLKGMVSTWDEAIKWCDGDDSIQPAWCCNEKLN